MCVRVEVTVGNVLVVNVLSLNYVGKVVFKLFKYRSRSRVFCWRLVFFYDDIIWFVLLVKGLLVR